jgi:hypothetical protein
MQLAPLSGPREDMRTPQSLETLSQAHIRKPTEGSPHVRDRPHSPRCPQTIVELGGHASAEGQWGTDPYARDRTDALSHICSVGSQHE